LFGYGERITTKVCANAAQLEVERNVLDSSKVSGLHRNEKNPGGWKPQTPASSEK
jgi:hypothetical protein